MLIYEDSIFFSIYQKMHLQKNTQQMWQFVSSRALSFPTPPCWYEARLRDVFPEVQWRLQTDTDVQNETRQVDLELQA